MRPIDADALLEKMQRTSRYFSVVYDVDAMPTLDVAPVVHGRWMHEETEDGFHTWRCSRCGRGMSDNPEGIDLYCYHCGARMDGGDKNG